MLIPRFTLRSLLVLTTVSALFCFVIGLAVRGQAWAVAVTIALSSLAIVFALHASVFAVAWCMALIGRVLQPAPVTTSPFINPVIPPPQQIIPPEDPE